MLNQKLIREKRKRLKMTVDELSEQLGISRDNLYKWEKGTKITDMDAYQKLENWLKGEVENVPRGNGNLSSNAPISDFKADYGHDFSSLVQSNLKLSNAQEKLAIAQENISESNRELSRQIGFIARESEESSLVAAGNLEAIRSVLRQLSLKVKLFQSEDEFDRAYDKTVGESLKKRKGADIPPDTGKRSKVKS